uniref:Uncharacterized protein n=1 Tax=Triticum urartu TaxID=4572 RepID=A0A8R7QVD1_TRIUA
MPPAPTCMPARRCNAGHRNQRDSPALSPDRRPCLQLRHARQLDGAVNRLVFWCVLAPRNLLDRGRLPRFRRPSRSSSSPNSYRDCDGLRFVHIFSGPLIRSRGSLLLLPDADRHYRCPELVALLCPTSPLTAG